MNLMECYEKIGGNYEDLMCRLRTEERIINFLSKFLKDPNFSLLEDSLGNHDYEAAFRAAHSLKGICLNLSLTALQQAASSLTENLRGGVPDENTPVLLGQVREEYQRTVSAIRQLTGN